MQVAAVVELAFRNVHFEIWHVAGQMHGINVIQAKFLKAWRVNQSGGFGIVKPIPCGAGGCVFA